MVAVLAAMALVYRLFPRRDEERTLRDAYHASDARAAPTVGEAVPGGASA
jgi:hypothetical protein